MHDLRLNTLSVCILTSPTVSTMHIEPFVVFYELHITTCKQKLEINHRQIDMRKAQAPHSHLNLNCVLKHYFHGVYIYVLVP